MKFYSLLEVEKMYGVSKNSLKWRCLQGDFKDAEQITGKNGRPIWMISENDVSIIKDEVEFIHHAYTFDEAKEKLRCTKEKIEKMMKDGLLKNHRTIQRKRYFNKKEIDQHAPNQKTDLEEYYDSKEVAELLGVSPGYTSYLLKNQLLKNAFEHQGKNYFLREEICEIKNILDTHYSTSDVSKLFNTTLQNITSQCIKGNFEGTIKNPIAPSKWLLPKRTIDEMLNHPKEAFVIENEYDVFKEYTKSMNTSLFPKTHELFSDFVTIKLKKSNSNNKVERAKQLTRVFLKFYPHLTKELFECTNQELDHFLNNDFFDSTSYKEMTLFLKFLKKSKKVKASFDKEYSFKRTKKKTNVNENIYSKDIWKKYYMHLTNIDLHIEKAFEQQSYACSWLYTLLHLVLDWRASDILKMPTIRLEEIGIDDFDWFHQKEFTLSIGENVINQVRNQSIFIRTNKTGTNAHFVMTLDLIIPTAISFVIAEIHRRKNKQTYLFEIFQKTKPKKDRHIKSVMQECEELHDFSSLKANRTLMTYGHESAVQNEGMAHLAYDLGTYMRSHKKGIDGISSITEQYIYSTNENGSVNDVSYHLFRRGFFGWLYREIAEITESKLNEDISLEERTRSIEQIKEQYDLIEIENIAEFLQEQINKKQSVVQELLSYNKEKLQQIIASLIKKEMPAKMKHAQCLKSGECPFLTSSTCFGCQYLIPEYYLLYSIKDELYQLIERLEGTPEESETERIKITHFIYRMLYLLQDVKKEYVKYDADFINHFFDMKQVQEKVNALQKTKFKTIS